jgi:hypothetical protein
MADDVLINKLTTIERCVKRARDERRPLPDRPSPPISRARTPPC